MAYSKSTYLGEEKFYYFTGKVRAFWKDKVFFLDQKNAAVVGFEKLYVNGHRASQTDLHILHAMVESSDWNTSPDLYSYVVKYSSNEVHPWPYKLKGKVLWFAHFAWIGTIPKAVEQQLERYNVVYMPLSYYTGKLISVHADKLLLFGDSRNSVMVHSRDLSFYGQNVDCRDALLNVEHHAPLVHAFIISLQFLTNENYEGPKPHLPTCPVDKNNSTMWLAKFAWVGEMPYEYRQLLKRFQIIEISEWNSLCHIGGNHPLSNPGNSSQGTLFSVPEGAKGNRNGTRTVAEPLLATTRKGAAIVKGLLLAASSEYGLINSSLDVIVFSVKNFYVDGEIYRDGKPLDEFFHDRSVSLTAWIVPLQEPVLVFDIYVMWRAVCVWFGIPPKNMEAIKKLYYNGTISGSVPQALNTTSDKRYTLVWGRITSISYNYGYAIAEVGNTTIDISFKRKALYMKGYKLHSKCNLLEIKGDLEASIWTMLVYPVDKDSDVMYTALALWEETYQHYVSSDLLYRILLEGRNVAPEDFHALEVAESSDKSEDDKIGLHMTGMIVKTTPEYGIIETRSITIEPSYVFLLRANFFIDGTVPEVHQMLHQLDKKRQVNLYARSTKCQVIDGYPVTMYATLAWMGKKSSENKRLPSKVPVELPVEGNSAIEHNEVNSSNTKAELSSQEGSVKKALKLIRTDSPVMKHRRGRFAQLQNRYGVIQCGNEEKGYTYVLFDFSVLWIDGDRLELHESLDDSIIEDGVQCNLLAYEISAVKVGAFQVNMQASAVWLGKKPCHIALPDVESPLKAMEAIVEQDKCKPEVKRKRMKKYLIKNRGNECKDISSKLSDVKLTDRKGLVPVSLENIAGSLDKPHVGKHITGRILKLMKGCGIAMWSCAAKEGEVYMFFFKKNIYVNLCPMDESYKVDKSKIFNFYVLPVLHKTLGVYRISLYATCGWKGSKPHDIPVPGEQDHARITLGDVYALEVKTGRTVPAYIVKLMGNKGIARWRSQPHGGDIFIEFKKSITCDNIKSFFDKGGIEDEENPRPCLFHVRPIEHKEIGDYVVSLTATYGWLGKKPAHFPKPKTSHEPTLLGQKLHVRPVPLDILEAAAAMAIGDTPDPGQLETKEEGLSALDSVEADLNKNLENKEKRRNKLEILENDEVDEITMEGIIVELYSNVGRLQGGDGKQHFFSRENSYLYGVCLNNVELWHVLVQDEIVSYRISEISTGESKISKMWIGPENVTADEAAVKLNEWCNKYSVPDGAMALLIHQLELAQDSSEKENTVTQL